MGRKPAYEFDVFVSYAEKDRAWVQDELKPRLESANLKAFIDVDEFMPGAVGINEFERGVKSSRRTILLFSRNFFTYNLARLGDTLTRHLDPGARDRRCIPVKIKPCKLPTYLSYLVPTDLTSQDPEEREKEWGKLIRSLQGKRPPNNAPKERPVEIKPRPESQAVLRVDPPPPTVSPLSNAIELFDGGEIYPNECDEIIAYLTEQLQTLDQRHIPVHKRYTLPPQLNELIGQIETFRNRYPKNSAEEKDDILEKLRAISEELDKPADG